MRTEALAFGYQPLSPLIENLDFSVNHGDRICIVGKNGRGKTTLLRLLAGALKPDAGEVAYNPNVEIGFFEQTNIQSLMDARTVEEEILYAHPETDPPAGQEHCRRHDVFRRRRFKAHQRPVRRRKEPGHAGQTPGHPRSTCSFSTSPPTIWTWTPCDAMLAAIDSFDGTVIMVTHNELFLHALAERLVIFQQKGVQVFEGGYQDFLDQWGWEEEGGGLGAPRKKKKTFRSQKRKKGMQGAKKRRKTGPS